MLTLIIVVLIVLLLAGYGGNRVHPVYTGGGTDIIWVVVAVLLIFLVLRLLGVL